MQTFATAREAKEFLVSRIVTEAEREGVPLSEIETKMLYFSETYSVPYDFVEVNEAFERDCDTGEYELKIAALIRNFRTDARKNNPDDFSAWKQAVNVLSREDHYLLVLISIADGTFRASGAASSGVSWSRVLKIFACGALIACIVGVIAFVYLSFGN